MIEKQMYLVVLFKSVTHVIRSESILKKEGVPHKLIPVPKSISSDCGVCIRILPEHRGELERALAGSTAEIVGIIELPQRA